MEPSTSDILIAWERGLHQSPGERALTLLSLSDETMDAKELLPAGRRDAALLRIRRRLLGDRIDGVVACKDCGASLDVTLSVASLLPDETIAASASASVDVDGWKIAFRVPTAADLAALRGVSGVEHGLSLLLRRCVIAAERDGSAVDIDEIEPAAAAALDEALAAVDPAGDTTLLLRCPACGAQNEAIFDSPSFLWRETQLLARGALLEVHDLASAYGWTEPQILALNPARRRFYLEAVGA